MVTRETIGKITMMSIKQNLMIIIKHSRLSACISGLLVLFCVKPDPIAPEPPIIKPLLRYADSSDVIINEVCVSNGGSMFDEYVNDPDWIELYNKGNSAINLSGYTLSDDSTNVWKWSFGNVNIDSGGYLLVFASGKDISYIKEKPVDEQVNLTRGNRWYDSLSGGRSTVHPYENASIFKRDGETQIVSATLSLVDNRPGLGWSSAHVAEYFNRTKAELQNDYSMYNAFELKMFLEKDKLLNIRFLQDSLDEWKGFFQTLRGTGIPDDIYRIYLIQGTDGLDLKKINGIYLESPENRFGTVSFTLKSVKFIHTGYNLHTNFKLSGKEGKLYLSAPDSLVLDHVKISQVPSGMTYGKVDGKWLLLKKATPGSANVQEYYASLTDAPAAVTKGGFYTGPVNVKLDCSPGAIIHYTLDGSIPTNASPIYSNQIEIDSTTVLRFVAMKAGECVSETSTETYFISETSKLPVISISTDSSWLFDPDTGIYEKGPGADTEYPYFSANFWSDKEIPAHIEFFEPDRKSGFAIDVGVSINGNYSRANNKKSLDIHFREQYGKDQLDYPLFPKYPSVTKFNEFILRSNGGNYGKGMIEDPMMQSLIDDRGIDHQKYRPVVVFINGKYFGLHQLLEPANVNYVRSNYGLDKQGIDFYDRDGILKQGTPDNWNKVIALLQSSVGTECTRELSDSVYELVKEQVDVHNFMDYMAFEIYINNTDWPNNNIRFWREKGVTGRWRWLIFDTDFGFGNTGYIDGAEQVDYNTLEFALVDTTGVDDWPNGSSSTFPLRALLKNQSFKEDFINRFATLISSNFKPERVKARIDEYANEIRDEIPKDYKRWNLNASKWQSFIDNLKIFADQRPTPVYGHIRDHFGLTGTYLLTLSSSKGMITVNDMPVNASFFTGQYFIGVPVRLKAIPLRGMQFKMWSDGSTENPRVLIPETDISIEAVFE